MFDNMFPPYGMQPQQAMYPQYQYPQQPQVNPDAILPDFSQEQHLLEEERARINELYSRIYSYLLEWEQSEGIHSRNPHLFLQGVLPTLTQLIGALHSNTTARANLRKIIADIKMKLARGEDDNKVAQDYVRMFISAFNDQRSKMSQSLGAMQGVVPLNFANGTVQSPITGDNAGVDVASMIRKTHEMSEQRNELRQTLANSDKQREQQHLSDPGGFQVQNFAAPIQEYPTEDSANLPEVRSVCISDGSVHVVDRANRVLGNYQQPTVRIIRWVEYQERMYGIGDDGYRYELVKLAD
jgi:hypothetical protein